MENTENLSQSLDDDLTPEKVVYETPAVANAAEAETAPDPGAMLPSRRLSIQVSGDDYLDYVMLAERILPEQRMTQRQKDEYVMQLGLRLLQVRVRTVEQVTGRKFVRESDLFA